ncbi:hypothetical protein AB1Y20_001142 [Prymnesium parvum]|uniref:Ubiquitin-like domain-containing protein n=1 Tax=Prymnesium parvum TaxID=97485 RepID=A0AB34KA13_PRYPA
MAPKRKVKVKKKAKKKEEDWGALEKVEYVTLEIRNSDWASMRFMHLAATTMTLDSVRKLIMEEHSVPSAAGLRLFMGAGVSEESLLKPEDFNLSLDQLSITGGSKNDNILQVITYEYQPFKSILNVPRFARPTPLRQ